MGNPTPPDNSIFIELAKGIREEFSKIGDNVADINNTLIELKTEQKNLNKVLEGFIQDQKTSNQKFEDKLLDHEKQLTEHEVKISTLQEDNKENKSDKKSLFLGFGKIGWAIIVGLIIVIFTIVKFHFFGMI